VNDTVLFDNKSMLAVGDTSNDDLRVLESSAPWSIRVLWKGIEFDVPLMQRDRIVLPPSEPGSPAGG
jgi:hypothetical protein